MSPRDDDAVDARRSRGPTSISSACTRRRSCTPQHVRAALGAGKAVLCDKPFALDADEARALVAEAAAAGVVALCNFEFRFASGARALLRDLVRDRRARAGSSTCSGRTSQRGFAGAAAAVRLAVRPRRGGGWIGAWGSHAVDTLR